MYPPSHQKLTISHQRTSLRHSMSHARVHILSRESLPTHQSGIWNESIEFSLPQSTVVPLLSKHVVKEYVWRHSS